MEPTDVYKISNYEQLKALADPLRTKILMNLVKEPYTGQQLAAFLGITRNNIYFHLKELEKHGFIHIVKKEEKNGIVQKYYRAVASRFIPEDHLLPNGDLIETSKQVFFETIELTSKKIKTAPSSSFELNESNQSTWKNLAATYQFQATEEEFTQFLNEFSQLYKKHFNPLKKSEKNNDRKSYFLSLIGFQDNSDKITFTYEHEENGKNEKDT